MVNGISMAMKKIKPQYGKVVPPVVQVKEENEEAEVVSKNEVAAERTEQQKTEKSKKSENGNKKKSDSKITGRYE